MRNDEKGYWETLTKTYSSIANFNERVAAVSDEFKKFIWQFFSYHYFERINIEKIK